MKAEMIQRQEGRGNCFRNARAVLTEGLATLAIMGTLAISASGCATPESQRRGPLASLSENLRESRVILAPVGEERVRASVLVFESAMVGNTASGEFVGELETECNRSEPGSVYGCVCGRSTEQSPELNLRTLRSAALVFEYFDPQGNDQRGTWSVVPGCEDVRADLTSAERDIQASVPAEDVPHHAECDVSIVSSQRVYLRVTFVPQEGQNISGSSAEIEFIRP